MINRCTTSSTSSSVWPASRWRRTLAGARTYGWLLAVGYGAAFVYGLFAVGEAWDFLSINWADNVLHLATALVGLVIALLPVRTAVGTGRTR